jgi:hypothetical protein
MSPIPNGPIRRPNQMSTSPSTVDDVMMNTSNILNTTPNTMALTKTPRSGTIVLESIVLARLFMMVYLNDERMHPYQQGRASITGLTL